MRAQRGSVLILALWAMGLLAVFALAVGSAARQKAALMTRLEGRSALQDGVLSGVERARGFLKAWSAFPHDGPDTLNSEWASNAAYFKEVATGPVVVTTSCGERFGFCDEGAKIALNTADVPSLTRLFELVGGVDHDTAESLAYCVVDWRDTDSTFGHPQYGAEDTDYHDRPLPYEAKDAPFQAVEELLLVKGMTREIFDRIKGNVTPAPISGVNLHTAPREVLLAVGLSEKLADKILDYRRGPDGKDGTADDAVFQTVEQVVPTLILGPKLDATEKAALETLLSTGAVGIYSSFFTARIACAASNGASLTATALLDREGGVKVLRWGKLQWS